MRKFCSSSCYFTLKDGCPEGFVCPGSWPCLLENLSSHHATSWVCMQLCLSIWTFEQHLWLFSSNSYCPACSLNTAMRAAAIKLSSSGIRFLVSRAEELRVSFSTMLFVCLFDVRPMTLTAAVTSIYLAYWEGESSLSCCMFLQLPWICYNIERQKSSGYGWLRETTLFADRQQGPRLILCVAGFVGTRNDSLLHIKAGAEFIYYAYCISL